MPKNIIFIVIIEIFKFYVGKWPTLGKFRAVGIYKLLGDGVAIFLQIPFGRRSDSDGEASHWACSALGRQGIGDLAGRPKIRRRTTRCWQLCDDYIPCTLFEGNYLINFSQNRARDRQT